MKDLLDAYYTARSWLDRQAALPGRGTTDDGRWPCRKLCEAFERFLTQQFATPLVYQAPTVVPMPYQVWPLETGTSAAPAPQQTEITCGPRAHE